MAGSGFFQSGSPATFTVRARPGCPPATTAPSAPAWWARGRATACGGVGAAPESDLMLVACLGDQVGTQTTLARAIAYAADPTTEGGSAANAADIIVVLARPERRGVGPHLDARPGTAGRRGQRSRRAGHRHLLGGEQRQQRRRPRGPRGLARGRHRRGPVDQHGPRGQRRARVRGRAHRPRGQRGQHARGQRLRPLDRHELRRTLRRRLRRARPVGAARPSRATQLREIMHTTADQIGGVVYDAAGHNDDYGFGRVNAFAAVRAAARRVTLMTNPVDFNDVPEGETTARSITWDVEGVEDFTFEVTSRPDDHDRPGERVPAAARPERHRHLPRRRRHRPGPDLAHLHGHDRGRHRDAARSRCTASRRTRRGPSTSRPTPSSARRRRSSWSWTSRRRWIWTAGDGRTRVQVLRESAGIFVDTLRAGHGRRDRAVRPGRDAR